MKRKKNNAVLYVYTNSSRLLNVLGTLFLKICYGKFCFINYLVNKGISENKKTSVTRTINIHLITL